MENWLKSTTHLSWLTVCMMLAGPVLLPSGASARNMEGQRLYLGVGLGPGIRLPTQLGAAPAALVVLGQGELTLNRRFSGITGITVGAASTVPIMGHLGVKGRLHDLGLAVSPYAQLQLGVGGLINVMGANLTWVGGRVGLGADYFVTKRGLAGVALLFDVGGTTGERPAFYGLVSLVLTAAITPNG